MRLSLFYGQNAPYKVEIIILNNEIDLNTKIGAEGSAPIFGGWIGGHEDGSIMLQAL